MYVMKHCHFTLISVHGQNFEIGMNGSGIDAFFF